MEEINNFEDNEEKPFKNDPLINDAQSSSKKRKMFIIIISVIVI